jgi:hypothetical protein
MDCPNCGSQTVPDQKFCRSCGSSLEVVTKPLPAPTKPATLERDAGGNISGRVASLGFIIMFIGVAIGVIGKMLLHEEIVTVVGILLSLAGMFLVAYPYLSPAPRQKHSNQSEPKALTPSTPIPSLNEGMLDYVPSITERTTNLLATPAVPATREKEDGESEL